MKAMLHMSKEMGCTLSGEQLKWRVRLQPVGPGHRIIVAAT